MSVLPDARDYADWRKAKRSKNNGDCAEVASRTGIVAMRDSKDPLGPVLQYPAGSWHYFLAAAKAGRFDLLP